MKKLFSTMLAATMVAGMAVTAFAAEPATDMTTDTFDKNDYGIIGAYKDNGKKLNDGAKLEGGDKIYFPILISGEEIDDEKYKNTLDDMYFATKRSEVDDLKASVKDEVGGKYINDAAIVKKNIEITAAGTESNDKEDAVTEIFTVDLKDMNAGKVDTAVLDKAAKDAADAKVITDKAAKDAADAKVITDKAAKDAADAAAAAPSDTGLADAKVAADAAKVAADKLAKDTADAAAAGKGGKVVTFTFNGVATEIKGLAENANATTIAAEIAKGSFTGYDVKSVGSVLTFTADKAEARTDATASAKVGAVAAVIDANVTQQGKGAVGENLSVGKIYCVEVEISDYFKNEETELEFNIKLKNNGRTEFDTEDDDVKKHGEAFFNGTFDLGSDSEKFSFAPGGDKTVNGAEATKFKKGDLEIEIGPDTKSIQLDEVVNKDGDDEDVDNIFIESNDEIDQAFTFDVKASGQDDLYLELNDDAVKDLAVSNQKADLTFFNFPGEPEFDFAGTATFAVEDEDEDNYFYEIVDGELVETSAKYDEDDGVFKLRTNKLGSYVLSDRELDTAKEKADEKVDDTEDKGKEGTGGDATEAVTPGANGEKGNANTGAADLIGVASALAVVSVAAAGAVALKK